MFTVDQIKTAHSKVKSGADFPAYIQELKGLGVEQYETFVADGHTDYYGTNAFKTSSSAKYKPLPIAEECNREQFERDLKEHQQGKTDYPTFIGKAANLGVSKWIVSIRAMTCTYFDKLGNEVLVEEIPS